MIEINRAPNNYNVIDRLFILLYNNNILYQYIKLSNTININNETVNKQDKKLSISFLISFLITLSWKLLDQIIKTCIT